MKKVFLSLLLASCSLWVAAQYNAVTLYYSTGKMEDAKKETRIDWKWNGWSSSD